jgi:hypothetical protein
MQKEYKAVQRIFSIWMVFFALVWVVCLLAQINPVTGAIFVGIVLGIGISKLTISYYLSRLISTADRLLLPPSS